MCRDGESVGKSPNCVAVTSHVDWIRATPWRRSLGADERLLHRAPGRPLAETSEREKGGVGGEAYDQRACLRMY